MMGSLNMSGGLSLSLLGGEVEVSGSRRSVDFVGCQFVRAQYQGLTALASMRIDVSADGGASWVPLVPLGPTLVVDVPALTPWVELPDELQKAGDLLVRAVAVGTPLLGLTLSNVELQYR
ncbi:MAG: hypothetical protein ABW123_11600 [Cystobacter sp.]